MARAVVRSVAVLALCAGAAACGGGGAGGAPSSSPASPATATAGTASATTSTPGTVSPTPGTVSPTPASRSPQESVGGVPLYQPSTTVSQTSGSAVLKSPDSVATVSAFYLGVISKDGWTTVSKTVTSRGASMTITKSGQGASIAVATAPGGGSVISISTYRSG